MWVHDHKVVSRTMMALTGHYGMWHTALWSCTHIPNIIDLSGKTKKLWSGQASLRRSGSGRRSRRRSGRENQTKTICLPSFEGHIPPANSLNQIALNIYTSRPASLRPLYVVLLTSFHRYNKICLFFLSLKRNNSWLCQWLNANHFR
jgi:hypothetical protein